MDAVSPDVQMLVRIPRCILLQRDMVPVPEGTVDPDGVGGAVHVVHHALLPDVHGAPPDRYVGPVFEDEPRRPFRGAHAGDLEGEGCFLPGLDGQPGSEGHVTGAHGSGVLAPGSVRYQDRGIDVRVTDPEEADLLHMEAVLQRGEGEGGYGDPLALPVGDDILIPGDEGGHHGTMGIEDGGFVRGTVGPPGHDHHLDIPPAVGNDLIPPCMDLQAVLPAPGLQGVEFHPAVPVVPVAVSVELAEIGRYYGTMDPVHGEQPVRSHPPDGVPGPYIAVGIDEDKEGIHEVPVPLEDRGPGLDPHHDLHF